jgi:hypothetical protein
MVATAGLVLAQEMNPAAAQQIAGVHAGFIPENNRQGIPALFFSGADLQVPVVPVTLHTLLEQSWPEGHLVPQEPQLFGS